MCAPRAIRPCGSRTCSTHFVASSYPWSSSWHQEQGHKAAFCPWSSMQHRSLLSFSNVSGSGGTKTSPLMCPKGRSHKTLNQVTWAAKGSKRGHPYQHA
ncbi:hypothetical protein AVEN_83695-1 [Araneus ventricosus]|uniref:Uncharacterized protein n=1 Tax=Araneus ventricosus TaxID=182803 RepID=A0A4Y2IRY4_ARAVE|nr:hypothetical protein AVEN_83695-1 [Araneus ventricosus]